MNDHEIIENLDLLLNMDLVTDIEDAELIENLDDLPEDGESEEEGKNE